MGSNVTARLLAGHGDHLDGLVTGCPSCLRDAIRDVVRREALLDAEHIRKLEARLDEVEAQLRREKEAWKILGDKLHWENISPDAPEVTPGDIVEAFDDVRKVF